MEAVLGVDNRKILSGEVAVTNAEFGTLYRKQSKTDVSPKNLAKYVGNNQLNSIILMVIKIPIGTRGFSFVPNIIVKLTTRFL